MESNKLFAETPPFKLFIRAALPGAIAMLASMLYDTADGSLLDAIWVRNLLVQ